MEDFNEEELNSKRQLKKDIKFPPTKTNKIGKFSMFEIQNYPYFNSLKVLFHSLRKTRKTPQTPDY